MLEKTIHLLMEDGDLAVQENTALFRLSVILEEFVYERENDSSFAEEVELAKRLDNFIWSSIIDFYDK